MWFCLAHKPSTLMSASVLLLRFLELKEKVSEILRAKNVGESVLETWAKIASENFRLEDEDEDLIF